MGIQSSITKEYTSSLTMKVMGLFAVTLAACLMSMTIGQPLFFPEPVSTAFTTAGGLVVTGVTSGATLASIPTGALVLGGLAAKKLALVKILESSCKSCRSNHIQSSPTKELQAA